MTINVTAKTVVTATIGLLLSNSVAVFTVLTQAESWERTKATAAINAAKAEAEKASAEAEKAKAMVAAAVEARKAAEESARLTANALIIGAQQNAAGVIRAAREQAEGLRVATTIAVRPESESFDGFLKPTADTTKRMGALNEKIARLKAETESGYDFGSLRILSAAEIANKTAQRLALESEHQAALSAGQKNLKDMIGLFIGGMSDGFGGLGSLYQSPNDSSNNRMRRIVVEEQ